MAAASGRLTGGERCHFIVTSALDIHLGAEGKRDPLQHLWTVLGLMEIQQAAKHIASFFPGCPDVIPFRSKLPWVLVQTGLPVIVP